jgi:hypothetical protein
MVCERENHRRSRWPANRVRGAAIQGRARTPPPCTTNTKQFHLPDEHVRGAGVIRGTATMRRPLSDRGRRKTKFRAIRFVHLRHTPDKLARRAESSRRSWRIRSVPSIVPSQILRKREYRRIKSSDRGTNQRGTSTTVTGRVIYLRRTNRQAVTKKAVSGIANSIPRTPSKAVPQKKIAKIIVAGCNPV